ncbi:MAG: 2-phosphosulfolactate phosphatase family protein [Clostridiales bacterium]|uniref:2-phosphosulfolactate phosphatase family protein n=1 Tax=Clostridium sp. N3C TaxID=1776758 RepID=UPI00092DFB55|nr:2-phosphosulfolactate phosphatase family protein [Clostridium sp. N3C]NLZ48889.1 2-phosphosulfolactate phosphatase family protein [Clostridiales bacterium]SCN24199.1 putative 2-phosphosulfolactate phosphatase [Clostridium sp. N3C]
MKVDIIISADYVSEDKIKGKTALVIDMLRATSVITTAVMNGCRKVIPVLTVERAFELAQLYKEGCILGGERKALKIDGFHCSNSPLEYTEDLVKDKTLIISTTNGTRTIQGCKSADSIFIGCLLNGKAAAERMAALGKDIVIVNAGTYGQFSMDDFICSGYIINCLKNIADIEMTDLAYTAFNTYNMHQDITSFICHARHYNVIKELGFTKDLEYCCQKDITKVVPYFNGEYITFEH